MYYAIEDITRRLKKVRQAKGLTQRGLSEKAGIPQSHISRIESGAVDIKLSSFIELARVLDMEIAIVPKRLVPAVEALLADRPSRERRPAYSLDETEDEGDA